jgi:hypothetical protein
MADSGITLTQELVMTMIRRRTTAVAFALFAAGLTACANDPTSPFDVAERTNATVDSTGRKEPTLPWYSVRRMSDSTGILEPTLPWYRKTAEPTLPWYSVQKTTTTAEPTLPWYKKTAEPTLPWY